MVMCGSLIGRCNKKNLYSIFELDEEEMERREDPEGRRAAKEKRKGNEPKAIRWFNLGALTGHTRAIPCKIALV